MPHLARPDLPSLNASELLARWLTGPRARLLRRVQIGLRESVLEVGCGHGVVTEELLRRAPGPVICIDRIIEPARGVREFGAELLAADVTCLPFRPSAFDLIFCQNVLMWVADVEVAVREMARALQPGGALVAIEPDYGGMIEHPPEIAVKDLWLKGLKEAGADPEVGRRLPALCERAGLKTWVELQGIPQPATPQATNLLMDLPLSDEDKTRAREAARAIETLKGNWDAFVHVPYFLVVGAKG